LRQEAHYNQTYLVEEDLRDSEEFRKNNFLKSIFALENSNINLIVLTFNDLIQGAIKELNFILAHPQLVFKSAVLVESEYDQDGNVVKQACTSLFKTDLVAVNFRKGRFRKINS
jgi:hypothetical protein